MLLWARLRTSEAFSGVQGERTPRAGRGDEVREVSLAMGMLPSALKEIQVMKRFSRGSGLTWCMLTGPCGCL